MSLGGQSIYSIVNDAILSATLTRKTTIVSMLDNVREYKDGKKYKYKITYEDGLVKIFDSEKNEVDRQLRIITFQTISRNKSKRKSKSIDNARETEQNPID